MKQNNLNRNTIPGYYTRKEAADLLGITPQRASAIAKRDGWTGHRVGQSWLYNKASVEQTLVKAQAQKAWAALEIPLRLWGAGWLADMDAIDIFECPDCGDTAYSPAGETKWSELAACPSCGWQRVLKPA